MVSSNGISVPSEQSFITTRFHAIKATIKRYRKNFAIASPTSLFCILPPCSFFLSQLFVAIKKTTRMKIIIPAAIISIVFIYHLFCDTKKEKVQTILYLHIRRYRQTPLSHKQGKPAPVRYKHFTNLLFGHILLIGDFPNVTCKK